MREFDKEALKVTQLQIQGPKHKFTMKEKGKNP